MNRILLVDDKESIRTIIAAMLTNAGYQVTALGNGKEALAMAMDMQPDLIVSDIRMPGMDGVSLFKELSSRGMNAPFIFITAYADVPGAVEAIKRGAVHYLAKPVNSAELLKTVKQALVQKKTGQKAGRSASKLIVGSGIVMKKLLSRVDAISSSDATVLMRGENGTGKELIARAIHKSGKRRNGPFVPVHCAALNINLLESELFGHEAGAFTNAIKRKDGYLEAARGGTLFLDEISEISQEIQIKLLRVLQERVYSRVGGTELISADFRLLAASNKDIDTMVKEGQFRSDLFYRLDVVPLHIPPLRDRLEDIPELVEHFVSIFAKREAIDFPLVDASFLECLGQYNWPGNIRELENLIERLLVLYRPVSLSAQLLKDEAPERFGQSGQPAKKVFNDYKLLRKEEEKRLTLEALEKAMGVKSEAARILGISRRALYYRLKEYKLSLSR
ncbi:sigma-54 dependent transcriptional regulator [Spirochaetota bacterium]